MSLVPTLKLSLEMTNTLSQIERNGLRINLDTLADIRKQYEEEMQELEVRLLQLAREAMGDTPINLSSPDDRSVLLYSRKVRDKKTWARTFNLGHEMRGSTMKPKQRVRMSELSSRAQCVGMTDVVYKTKRSNNALTAPEKAVHAHYVKMVPRVRQYASASPVAALASFTCLRAKWRGSRSFPAPRGTLRLLAFEQTRLRLKKGLTN